MIAFGFFDHAAHDGTPFWHRLEARYPPEPHRRWAVGENLLYATPGVGPAQAITAWLASPKHRATLLNPAWRDVGVAVLRVNAAPGVFKDRPTMVVTADFGVR